MSRNYSMSFTVTGIKTKEDMMKVVYEMRPYLHDAMDFWREDEEGKLAIWGETTLSGGMDEEEYLAEISGIVWECLGYFVPIDLAATYLDDLPFDSFTMGATAYEEWKKECDG